MWLFGTGRKLIKNKSPWVLDLLFQLTRNSPVLATGLNLRSSTPAGLASTLHSMSSGLQSLIKIYQTFFVHNITWRFFVASHYARTFTVGRTYYPTSTVGQAYNMILLNAKGQVLNVGSVCNYQYPVIRPDFYGWSGIRPIFKVGWTYSSTFTGYRAYGSTLIYPWSSVQPNIYRW